MRTSGLAVAFSGVTVIIALAGLFLIDSKTAHSMAIGAIVVVGVAVLAAVTLLPALIGALGHRAYEPGKVIGKVVAKLTPKPKPEAVPFWTRWTNRLMNRPWFYATLATAVMLLIAAPADGDEAGHGRHHAVAEGLRDRQGQPARRPGRRPGCRRSGPDRCRLRQQARRRRPGPAVRRGGGTAPRRGPERRRQARGVERRSPRADRGDLGDQPGGRRDLRPGAAHPLEGRPRCLRARTSTWAAPRRRITTSPT